MSDSIPSVLVVDDDPDLREAMRMILEAHGYAVDTAADGREALVKLRLGKHPNVILLDLMMPGMNGAEFRHEQLQDASLSAIPVLVLTGDGSASEKGRSLQAEGLRKPLDLDVLLGQLGRLTSTPS